MRRIATLEEVERSWEFMDIMKAAALLDYEDDRAALETERAERR